jgi:hypothetical protein
MPVVRAFTVGDDIDTVDMLDGSIFLAGPVERVADGAEPTLPRWRDTAHELLHHYRELLVVFNPEWRVRPPGWTYEKQVAWEITAMARADAILCWIPRHLPQLPGFTTNVEVGEWLRSNKLFVGAPPNTPHTRYIETRLTWLKRPWFTDLPALVDDAVELAIA